MAIVFAILFFSSSVAWIFYEIGKNQASIGGEPTQTTANATPTQSPIVLEPTWIGSDKPILIFSNQVIVQATTIYTTPGYHELDYAGVKIVLPENVVMENRYLKRGERVYFSYREINYSITILDIKSTEIKVSIEEILE